MNLTQQLITYYKGERLEATLLTGFGLVIIVIAIAMLALQ
jgi:hypothetical protein